MSENAEIPENAEAETVSGPTFDDLGLSPGTLEALRAKGFVRPTPIQALTIPALLKAERDLVASAQTGTGKTAAFGIPLVERLSRGDRPQALVMTPTRELALQVAEEMESFRTGKGGLRFVTVYGGQSISAQAGALRRGADVVVGTPGRVKDMLSRGLLDMGEVRWFVLDEADEMLKMGFIEDVEEILAAANPERRVLLFSATMPKPILHLAERYLKDYEFLSVKSEQKTSDLTRQYVMEAPRDCKGLVLCRLIDSEPKFYGLVFAPTRAHCDEIAQELNKRGFSAEALHGDISQPQREKVLERFRARRVRILVATDVAARGIDVPEITHVVNFEPPREVDSYVHRVGRTGRAGKEGVAVTLACGGWDWKRVDKIRAITHADIQPLEIPSVEQIAEAKKKALFDALTETLGGELRESASEFAEKLLERFDPRALVAGLLEMGWKRDFDEDRHPRLPEIRRRAPRGREEGRRRWREDDEFDARKYGRGNGGGEDREERGARRANPEYRSRYGKPDRYVRKPSPRFVDDAENAGARERAESPEREERAERAPRRFRDDGPGRDYRGGRPFRDDRPRREDRPFRDDRPRRDYRDDRRGGYGRGEGGRGERDRGEFRERGPRGGKFRDDRSWAPRGMREPEAAAAEGSARKKRAAMLASEVVAAPGQALTRAQRRAIQFGHQLDENGNIVATRGRKKEE